MNKWFKSSKSAANGQCLQVKWFKSTKSGTNGNCVEVASSSDGEIWLRDSKLGEASPVLKFTTGEWQAFVDGVRENEFDISV